MKGIWLVLVLTLSAAGVAAQTPNEPQAPADQSESAARAPLLLFTNGPGRVAPLHDGQMLEVGRAYTMVAIPDPGCAFTNWNPVVVFTFVEYVYNPAGGFTTVTSTVVSAVPQFSTTPALRFSMEPVQVILNDPGVRTITRSVGWQANLVVTRKRGVGAVPPSSVVR